MTATHQIPFLDLAAVNAPYADRLHAAAARVIDSGRFVGGAEVESFEAELAAFTGTKYAVGTANGLDALRLILRAYIELGRLAPGDEVIVAANTYIASVLAITDCGLRPVLVEPDPRTLNLDTSRIEAAVTPRTRAVMPVHLYGRACHDAALQELADRLGLIVVEDNAQAIGARSALDGRRTGALGHAAAFSFYPTKNVGALGDAGAVTTDDEALAKAVRALANYGSDRRYHNIYKGLNSRLDPLQAAFLRVKLPHTDDENGLRRRLAAVYESEIDSRAVGKPLFTGDDMVWHQYVIMTEDRDGLRQFLSDHGVGTDVHYAVPPHRQPCYADMCGLTALPVTEHLADRVLSLPIARGTSEDDARRVASLINQFGK